MTFNVSYSACKLVPISNLLATVFFKKRISLKKSRVRSNLCVLCRIMKRESVLSLCEPWTLFKGFNQNPIKNPIDSGTMKPEVLKC